jgi:hypothetical protein
MTKKSDKRQLILHIMLFVVWREMFDLDKNSLTSYCIRGQWDDHIW